MIPKLTRAVLAAFVLLPASALAADSGSEFVSRLRAITQQYDQIANRDISSSPVSLGEAREKYGNALRAAAAAGAHSQELREYAEIFVLSGGDASLLKPWDEGLEPGSKEKKLFDGIMAYGTGRTYEAKPTLLALNAKSFDSMRGGHLSLAQALLSLRGNPELAFSHFDAVRFILPGTLVEEAALRQTALLAAKTNNKERFLGAVDSYFGRFPRSAYIDGFEVQLVFHIARFSDPDALFILQNLLATRPRGWSRCLSCFLTSLAEQAIILGKPGLASAAATAAMPLVPDDAPQKQRLLLYHGSALVVTDSFDKAIETLRAIKEESLDQQDAGLLRASFAIAAKLRATPVLLNRSEIEALASNTPKQNRVFARSRRREEARAALATADALLTKAK